jgi:hypothetical protein
MAGLMVLMWVGDWVDNLAGLMVDLKAAPRVDE